MAVDENALSRPHLAEDIRGCEVPEGDRLGCRVATLGARGRRRLAYFLVSEQPGEVLERLWVGDAGQDHLGAVVRHDGGRAVASVDGVDLCDVLEDGDELDPLPLLARVDDDE